MGLVGVGGSIAVGVVVVDVDFAVVHLFATAVDFYGEFLIKAPLGCFITPSLQRPLSGSGVHAQNGVLGDIRTFVVVRY